MENLIELLSDIRSDVDFENATDLVSGGILKSFDIIQIVGAINDEYDIAISVSELRPENFDSVAAMLAMIERLEDE